MVRTSARLLAGAMIVAGVAACNNDVNTPDITATVLSSAFNSAPVGASELSSSFFGSSIDDAWAANRGDFAGLGGPNRGPGGPGGPGGARGEGVGFMGGGMDGAFFGIDDGGHGRGHERGPFASGIDSTCTFASGTGDVTCAATRNGLTITRVYSFKTTAGTAQAKPDSTTNSERSRITVAGTTTSRNGAVTSTVSSSSDRTVTGLASAATQRTVNGTSRSSESSAGKNRDNVTFTSVRLAGDTTVGLIVPKPTSTSTTPPYPKAGTVTRSMRVTLTLNGGTPTTSTRREVVTYDGTATAKVVITQDGTTKNCTLPLPRGRLTCQ
jgi:hypothetical protein